MVPHLTTALSGPWMELERRILERMPDIERWLRTKWQEHAIPFYASVDLRNAGFKLAPVDTNLFPGGFNNLNPAFLPLCVQAVQAAVERVCADARGVLLDPGEPHAQPVLPAERRDARKHPAPGRHARAHRLDSIPRSRRARRSRSTTAGFDARAVVRHGRRVGLAGFDPCMVLLNNDLSAGVPDVLAATSTSRSRRRSTAGWYNRQEVPSLRASTTRSRANSATLLDIDPWLVDPYFGVCSADRLPRARRRGVPGVERRRRCSTASRAKYAEYGIEEKPFVIVKADAGTYGMGIMTVRDPSEVVGLNRKQRNKMAVVKEGLEVSVGDHPGRRADLRVDQRRRSPSRSST